MYCLGFCGTYTMQTQSEKTGKLLLSTEEELFASIIDARHLFRKLKKIINFPKLIDSLFLRE